MKDAALLTLEIGRMALQKNMILKDASAYNIQFLDGKPILIDTLSFDIYHEGQLWDGYRQFLSTFFGTSGVSVAGRYPPDAVDARLHRWDPARFGE